MAIYGTGIASKKRVLLSRQHCELKRADLEMALSCFNRMVEKNDSDFTYVETEGIRFVYQPVDDYYVFVMTSIDSNIVRDIGIVHTLAEIVQSLLQSDIDEGVREQFFDIIFYMDELITNKQPEDLTIDQIKEYILMDSQEEKKHNIIRSSKEKEEKERRNQMAAKIEKHKQLDASFVEKFSDTVAFGSPSVVERSMPVVLQDQLMDSGVKLSINRLNYNTSNLGLQSVKHASAAKNGHDAESIELLEAEAPVVIKVVEMCTGNIHMEGDVDFLNVQGELMLTIYEESARMVGFSFVANPEFKMRFHPIINKETASKNIVELQNSHQGHKIGHSTSLVKWRQKSTDETSFPLSVSCWPNTNLGQTTVTVEIQNNSDAVINSVNFQILDSRFNQIIVNSHDLGNIERNHDALNWVLGNLCPQQSGRVELTTNGDLDSILPFTLVAKVSNSVAQLNVTRCYDMTSGVPLEYVLKTETSFSMTIGSEGT
ncbi:coatomer subunit [Babesia bovis T2Bo]|uniref:coatomer subunit n=1 Tax=Babesia bovis T2Bo TaxID=484906 RepID=UPI001C350310|nr:coatomer subunit [Babesia bovis T2Bo]EDO06155.2 coatomer subunit [Babesia bovis T2Bo]